MNTFLGACQNLTEADVDEAIVSQSSITYLEGYLWDPPEAKAAFVKASKIARAAGQRVALTLSDAFCVDRYRDEFLGSSATDRCRSFSPMSMNCIALSDRRFRLRPLACCARGLPPSSHDPKKAVSS